MANFRSKLRGLGCSEVTINSLKNKNQDKRSAALNVKKPRRAEVNYCPQHPKGETTESLEKERVALLSENKKRNNDFVVTLKMENTFSYRRQEILEGEPLVTDFKSRSPALFNAKEINKEFHRISTVPLISTFFAALDRYTPRLMELFQGKGGVQGRKMIHLIVDISKDDTIETKRACVLKSLCVYLNEDPDKLFKDYMNTDTEVSACKAQTVLGVYAMKREGAEPGDELEDVGVLIEGEEINKEFHRISTVPLISTFFAALDRYTPRLMELFQGKGGVQGRKMRHLIVDISKDDTIETKRACVLKSSLNVYLNEDPDKLFKDYMNTDTEVSACKAQTVLGVYAMKREGAEPGDELEDVGVPIEGEEVAAHLSPWFVGFTEALGPARLLTRPDPGLGGPTASEVGAQSQM
ncbi:unnamed protein product [Arctogadus glacialis]